MRLKDISHDIREQKEQGKTVVLVTGVFDILHQEHINFLYKARESGDILVIGIESDMRVKQLKGPARPINAQEVREEKLRALKIADFIFTLPDEFSKPQDHEKLIEQIRPDILAVSSHTQHLDKKEKILSKFGGHVKIVHQYNPEISTSQIIKDQHDSPTTQD